MTIRTQVGENRPLRQECERQLNFSFDIKVQEVAAQVGEGY